MKGSARSVSYIAAILFIVLVAAAVTILVYMGVSHTWGSGKESVKKVESESRCQARIVALKPRIGFLEIHVYTTCRAVVDTVYFLDPVTRDVLIPVRLLAPVELKPWQVNRIVLPLLEISKRLEELDRPLAVALGTSAGFTLVSSNWVNPYSETKKALENAWLVLLADRDGRGGATTYQWWASHWVAFNFVTGEYFFYTYTGSTSTTRPLGPYQGVAPVLRDTDRFVVQCTRHRVSNAPVKSPVVIVFNPTNGLEDWTFTWIDASFDGECGGVGCAEVFHVPRLAAKPGEVVYDFLVFWEDLWNPVYNPRLDDWIDHVVRVTLFINGTIRLQVFIAKGGYLHVFKHQASASGLSGIAYSLCPGTEPCYGFCVEAPTEKYDYCKSHSKFWAVYSVDGSVYVPECGDYRKVRSYEPDPARLWYVRLG